MDSSSTSRAPPFPQTTTTTTTATWPDLPILTPAGDASPPAKEHMFDKVVTPSDVGKLNRLVIPKQHAEKYFPLDSSTSDTKGLLLNFEDRHGKPWRFRYSYWNSSQSYVMTKGWSRFVKDKKLDAGDIVSFARGAAAGNKDRFYIDWRRRPDAPPPYQYHHLLHHRHPPLSLYNGGGNVYPWNAPPARDWGRVVGCYNGNYNNNYYYNYNYGMVSSPNLCHHGGSVVYLGAGSAAVGPPQQQGRGAGRVASDQDQVVIGGGEVFDSVPVVQGGKAAGKRLRLFGVNMDCNEEEEEEEEDHNQRRHHVQLHDFGLDSDRGSLSDKGKSSASLDLDI